MKVEKDSGKGEEMKGRNTERGRSGQNMEGERAEDVRETEGVKAGRGKEGR